MKKVRPLTCKILLRMVPQTVEKVGLIELTETTAVQLKTFEIGIVEAIGDTAFGYAEESKELCKVGDRVYIVKCCGVVIAENAGYSTKPVKDQVTYRLVNDEDILCVEVDDE